MKPLLHVKWVTKLKKEKMLTRRPYQLASPVVSGETIYVGTASGRLYALDAKDGHKDWNIRLNGGVYSEPLIDGDSIYVADRKGTVYSIIKENGKLNWQTETGSEISSRPLVVGDTVYITTVLRQLIALDRNSGGRKWQTLKEGLLPPMTIKGSSSPVFYNGNIYVGYADGSLVSYKPSDGSLVWKRDLSNRNSQFQDVDSTPIIEGGIIYISTVDGKTYALDPNDGHIIWKIDRGGADSPVVYNNYIFVTGGGILTCAELSSGKVIWEQDFGEPEISRPVVKNEMVILASTQDKLYVVDVNTGELKYKRFLGKGSFGKSIIDNETIYILTNSSKMFALQ